MCKYRPPKSQDLFQRRFKFMKNLFENFRKVLPNKIANVIKLMWGLLSLHNHIYIENILEFSIEGFKFIFLYLSDNSSVDCNFNLRL